MKKIEIYFKDLKQEKQKEILKAKGINIPEEHNLDVFPIHIMRIVFGYDNTVEL